MLATSPVSWVRILCSISWSGCPECFGSGYRGRTVVAEVPVPAGGCDARCPAREDRDRVVAAIENTDFQPIEVNARELVLSGTTTVDLDRPRWWRTLLTECGGQGRDVQTGRYHCGSPTGRGFGCAPVAGCLAALSHPWRAVSQGDAPVSSGMRAADTPGALGDRGSQELSDLGLRSRRNIAGVRVRNAHRVQGRLCWRQPGRVHSRAVKLGPSSRGGGIPQLPEGHRAGHRRDRLRNPPRHSRPSKRDNHTRPDHVITLEDPIEYQYA